MGSWNSFRDLPAGASPADLENCTGQAIYNEAEARSNSFERAMHHRISPAHSRAGGYFDHRQDMKGIRWMPWHLKPMKDVDGCDKPRLGAEQPLTRGSPNGKTRHL